MRISIVVPIYNEAPSIRQLHAQVCKVFSTIDENWELIFVNDGSHDDTEEILDELAAQDPSVKVIHFRRNFGQTAATMAGFDFAQGDIIIPMDGDLQNDPADIPQMIAKLEEGFDVCSGWRRDRKDDALQRNIPSILANKLISFVSGVRLHDFGCSLKAYRREIVDGVRLYGEMHRFLPIYAKWHGARITEIVVRHHSRSTGRSKYGLERVLKVLCDLIVVKFLDKFGQKPMYIFGGMGFASFVASFLAFVWMIWLKAFYNKPFIETPVPLIVVGTAITGVIFVLMGLLAEMIMRTFYESQGKSVYLIRETRNLHKVPEQIKLRQAV
jgi:glycosyltransferase involved in cell wall biosynthesis